MAGIFGDFFSGLRFPRNEAQKILQNIREKFRSKIRGEIRDENAKNAEHFRSATFQT